MTSVGLSLFNYVETEVDNKHLIVAYCWLFVSLHTLLSACCVNAVQFHKQKKRVHLLLTIQNNKRYTTHVLKTMRNPCSKT